MTNENPKTGWEACLRMGKRHGGSVHREAHRPQGGSHPPEGSARPSRQVPSGAGDGKELTGQIQSVGAGHQRKVHLPWIRLLLGENPAQSQVRGGQIADHFQEIQGQCAGHDGQVRQGGEIPPLQVAESSQLATILHLEPVHQPSPFLETAPTSDRLPITSIDVALAGHSSLKCLANPCPTLYLRVHPRSPVR